MAFRNLTNDEIMQLQQHGCRAEDWQSIRVSEGFRAEFVSTCAFAGTVTIGRNGRGVEIGNGIQRPAGLYNSFIKDCNIGDDVYVSGVRYLCGYDIADGAVLENVDEILMTGTGAFGNGTELEIVNEGGARELIIFDCLSAQMAYLQVMYRHDEKFIDALRRIITDYVDNLRSERGEIGTGAKVRHCGRIRNVHIGQAAKVEGAAELVDGTIAGSTTDPVFIGRNVIARHFVLQSGAQVDSGALLEQAFVGQGVQVGEQASAKNSAFFANSEIFHGEFCSVFCGPYSVSHHKSTLLIAAMFSFYNAGSGSNQSNHMYKLGPVHQGILERGAKTGSFSYLLWPARVGAFSAVIGKHYANFDSGDFPFSYILESGGKSLLMPAMNLCTVGTVRDSAKWPQRDRRKDPDKRDLIHFELFSPFTVGKIMRGIAELQRLDRGTPSDAKFAEYNGLSIKRSKMKEAIRLYEMAVDIFIGEQLLRRLETENRNPQEKWAAAEASADERWVDVGGLLARLTDIEELMQSVAKNKLDSVDALQKQLQKVYGDYENNCWNWCAALLEKRTGKKPAQMNSAELKKLIEKWRDAKLEFHQRVLEDARKEFDGKSRIGFGADGDIETCNADFEAVRGKYEENKFVKQIGREMEDWKKQAAKWMSEL